MIEKLILDDFGKYRHVDFSFKPVTFFYGKNESGKTTLFDALFQVLCSPKANKKQGKLLKARYSDSCSAKAVFTNQAVHLDADEFMNLYAVRSGDLNLDLSSGSTWTDRVKSSLFTGGLDPQKLKHRFENLASTRGSLKHNKILQQHEDMKIRLQDDLEVLNEKRQRILTQETGMLQASIRVEQMDREIYEMEQGIKRIEEELAFENKIAERKKLKELHIWIVKGEEIGEELESLGDFKTSAINYIDQLQGRLQSFILKLDAGENNEQRLKTHLQTDRNRIASMEEVAQNQIKPAGFAAGYLDKIFEFRKKVVLKSPVRWNRKLVLAAALLFAAGIGVGFLFDTFLYQSIFTGAGLVSALFFLILARKQDMRIDSGTQDDYLKYLKDEWRNRTGRSSELLSETLDGLVMELQSIRLDADRTTEDLREIKAGMRLMENNLAEQTRQNMELKRAIENVKKEISECLSCSKVSSRDEYLEKRIAYNNALKGLEGWEKECRRELDKRGCESLDQLKRDCERRLNLSDKEAVPDHGRTEAEVRLLEKALREKKAALGAFVPEQTRSRRHIDRERGEIAGSLSDIPAEIVKTQKAMQKVANQIEKIKLDRYAASLARDIFERISKNSESSLLELSKDISRQFEEIIPSHALAPGVPVPKVKIFEFNTDSIMIADAEGQKRSLEFLSSGMRDCFLLAARLALAKMSGIKEGILILDEPFIAMDSERTLNALKMLKNFQIKNHWQLILFSKDEQLIIKASSIFPDAMCNDLK